MKKRGIGFDALVPWIIGLSVLVVIALAIIGLSGKGIGILDFFKNFRRFGG